LIKFLAIIPARGGSKGIPNKNSVDVAGKPLIQYTIEAALKSKCLDRLIISTDDKKIAKVGKKCGVKVPFMRPDELAQDDTPAIDVVLHTLDWLKQNNSYKPDVVVYLQPTSPLRTEKHIDEAIQLYVNKHADTVVSVIEVPHNFSPYKLLKLDQEKLVDFWKEPIDFNRYQRQEVPKLYARNGPAILITKTDVIRKEKTFYGEKVSPYMMDLYASIDIDTPSDLRLSEWLITQVKEDI